MREKQNTKTLKKVGFGISCLTFYNNFGNLIVLRMRKGENKKI